MMFKRSSRACSRFMLPSMAWAQHTAASASAKARLLVDNVSDHCLTGKLRDDS